MARWEPEQTVTQSVLDRLIARDPESHSENPPTRAQSVRQLKTALRRDLEWLLNSRRTPEAVDGEYEELEKSLYNFGLPDVTSLSWDSSRDRARLARMIEQVLLNFEPRISGIRGAPRIQQPFQVAAQRNLQLPHRLRARRRCFRIAGGLAVDQPVQHRLRNRLFRLPSRHKFLLSTP